MNAFAKAALGYVLTVVSVRVVFGGSWPGERPRARLARQRRDRVAALALLLRAPLVLVSRESLWRAAATGVTAGARGRAQLPVARLVETAAPGRLR